MTPDFDTLLIKLRDDMKARLAAMDAELRRVLAQVGAKERRAAHE